MNNGAIGRPLGIKKEPAPNVPELEKLAEDLITFPQLRESLKSLYSASWLREKILHAEENGLKGAIYRISKRKLLISKSKFMKWLEEKMGISNE